MHSSLGLGWTKIILTVQIRLRFKIFDDLGFRFRFRFTSIIIIKFTVRFGFNERKWLIRVFGLRSSSVRHPDLEYVFLYLIHSVSTSE